MSIVKLMKMHSKSFPQYEYHSLFVRGRESGRMLSQKIIEY